MGFDYDGAGVRVGGFVIPEGEYSLEITTAVEGKSRSGDYQVRVNLKVVLGPHKDFKINYHRVTFMRDKTSAGAGIALNFLKSIGQPWEGSIQVSPARWVGHRLIAYLVPETFNGFESMKIKWVKPIDQERDAQADNMEDVPF